MIDRFMVRRGNASDVLHTDAYTPKHAIEDSQLHNENGDGLAVLFPPWHNGGKFYERLSARLVKKGWAVLSYKFSGEILKPDIEQVLASFAHIRDHVGEDVNKLNADNRYKKIHLIGASLGNVSMAMTASVIPDFTSAQFTVAAGNLARSTWEGSRTQGIRMALENLGHSEDELDDAWASIAPAAFAKYFDGKVVHALVSLSDTVIPTKYQHQMVNALSENSSEIAEINTKLGHYATIARFCLSDELPSPHVT